MSKPDWKDAPDAMRYLAQDANGSWWWYAQRPLHGDRGWKLRNIFIGATCLAHHDCENYEWRDTLERRP